jgi:hypothetical protein
MTASTAPLIRMSTTVHIASTVVNVLVTFVNLRHLKPLLCVCTDVTTDDKMWTMTGRGPVDAARAHVIEERQRRGMSARRASEIGGITNTVWSKFEAGGNITPGLRKAVANAFGWPHSWPEQLPDLTPEPEAREDELTQRLERIEGLVVQLLQGQIAGLTGLEELLQQRLPEAGTPPRSSRQASRQGRSAG